MFENRLKNLREQKGYTMKQMAEALGMRYTTYVNYEKNEREPNSECLVLIAKYFGVTVDFLLGINCKVDAINSNDMIEITDEEMELITAYRQNPEMQPAIKKLLGIAENK